MAWPKGKPRAEETKRKIGLSQKGKSVSFAGRQRMSAAKREYWDKKGRKQGSKVNMCTFLKIHAEQLKDDPNRLTSNFLKGLFGANEMDCIVEMP